MFEVGAEYMLTYQEGEEKHFKYGVVKSYQHPLIKFRENSSGKLVIYNASAVNFVSAERR